MKTLDNMPTVTCGDAMAWLRGLPDACADLVLTDPPYGTTDCAWDLRPDFRALFGELWRVLKPAGKVAIFCDLKLAAHLVTLEPKTFRYEWIWNKTTPCGCMNAKLRPMIAHEYVLVFSRTEKGGVYKAVPLACQKGTAYTRPHSPRKSGGVYSGKCAGERTTVSDGSRYPQSVLRIPKPFEDHTLHPTRKPLELVRAILCQYIERGAVVLDPFAGSGTTGEACRAEGAAFYGCEINPDYAAMAARRIAGSTPALPNLF